MPSIEIICIGQQEPLTFNNSHFEVQADKELISHRSPSPLFQSDFDGLCGCIYHLTESAGRTAYGLLKRDWYDEAGDSNEVDENIEFRAEFAPEFLLMLERLLSASPERKILFTSDYQFGPTEAKRFEPISLEVFWQLHSAGEIRMNATYWIIS